MRPLIALLLVVLAGVALFFALDLFRSGPDTPQTAGPTVVAPGPAVQDPGVRPLAPVANAGGGVRDVAEPVPMDETEAPDVAEPGRGNRLVGNVSDTDGRSVVGAEVLLSRDAMMGDALATDFFINRKRSGKSIQVETDGSGRYLFQDVAPGSDYYVVVRHPDYAAVQESLVAVGEVGEFRGPDFVLSSGSRLVGTVRDEGGNAVPQARLSLESVYNWNPDQESPDRLEVESDAFGHYEFLHVHPGPRNLSVSAPGYASQSVQGELKFGDEPGEEITRDFTLMLGIPIAGQVVGPEGRGIPGARVIAVYHQGNTTSRGEALTDANGRFQIDGLSAGPYIMQVLAEGYEQGRMNRIQAGKVDVVIELRRLACISGRVLAAGQGASSFSVRLRRTSANPAPGAPVFYENTDMVAEVQGGDGSFTICGVTNGTYDALVTAPGFAPTPSPTFQVLEDQAPLPITIALSAGGHIRGRVLDPSGAPVSGARVRCADNVLSGPEDDPFFANMFTGAGTERKGTTNVEGYFDLAALTPATYVVHVEHSRLASRSIRDIQVAEGGAVDLGNVVLPQGGSVRGVVRDKMGQALPLAFVQLVGTDETANIYRTRADGEGHYVFEHVRPGSYRLSSTRQPPGSSSDPFEAILEQQASQVSISIGDQVTLSQDLSLGR